MAGPRPLRLPAAVVTVTAVLLLAFAPVAGLPSVGAPVTSSELAPGFDRDTAGTPPAQPAIDTRYSTALGEPVASQPNMTSYLALAGETATQGFGTATFDAAGAVAADSARTHSTYETTRLRLAFRSASDNRTRRRVIIERAASRIDKDIARLERRERSALRQYNAGSISAQTYLREISIIHRAAGSLHDTVNLLATYSAAVGQPVSEQRIAAQKARLIPMEGPVRGLALDAATGETSPRRIYVETSDRGVVLASIERGPFINKYIREAYVPSARQAGGADAFELSEDKFDAARNRFRELYPWAWANREKLSIGTDSGDPPLTKSGVYPVQISHPHGTPRTYDLVTFFDGATRDVFREVQYEDLSTIPTTFAGTNTTDGFTISVNRTRTGGPMLVTVTSATTGDPVRAQILINGDEVGKTDANGKRWVIAPSPTATVTAVRADGTVSTTVFSDGTPTT